MSKRIDTAVFYNSINSATNENFNNQIRTLNERIEKDLYSSEGSLKTVLEKILKMPDSTKEDFEAKNWLYNNGFLRTTEEIEYRNKRISDENYYNTTWKNKKNPRTTEWKALILQFFMIPLGVFLSCKTKNFSFLFIGILMKAILLLFIIIHSAVKSSSIISEAQRHNISSSDPIVRNAYIDKSVLITGGIYQASQLKSNIKNNSVELLDPDRWSIHV